MRGIIKSAPSSKTEKIWSELVKLSHFVQTFYLFHFFCVIFCKTQSVARKGAIELDIIL